MVVPEPPDPALDPTVTPFSLQVALVPHLKPRTYIPQLLLPYLGCWSFT